MAAPRDYIVTMPGRWLSENRRVVLHIMTPLLPCISCCLFQSSLLVQVINRLRCRAFQFRWDISRVTIILVAQLLALILTCSTPSLLDLIVVLKTSFKHRSCLIILYGWLVPVVLKLTDEIVDLRTFEQFPVGPLTLRISLSVFNRPYLRQYLRRLHATALSRSRTTADQTFRHANILWIQIVFVAWLLPTSAISIRTHLAWVPLTIIDGVLIDFWQRWMPR